MGIRNLEALKTDHSPTGDMFPEMVYPDINGGGVMARHSASDEHHERSSTYGDRSKLNVENTRLTKKMIAEGKVKPPEDKK